jgi:hypothetical protein
VGQCIEALQDKGSKSEHLTNTQVQQKTLQDMFPKLEMLVGWDKGIPIVLDTFRKVLEEYSEQNASPKYTGCNNSVLSQ